VRLSRAVANAAVVVVSLAIAFAGAEFAFRALPAAERFGWNEPIALAERVAGLPAKRPGEIRVLALADSFGVFLDRQGGNFLNVAERLARAAGADVRVVNLSVAGTGLRTYVDSAERHGPAVSPDVMLVGIYLGNDIGDYEVAVRLGESPAGGPAAEAEGTFHALELWLKRHSLLLNAVFRLGKLRIPALRGDTFDRVLAWAGKIYAVPAEEIARRLERVNPETVRLARADALNPWLLAYGIVHPAYYEELFDLPAGTSITSAFELFLRDIDVLAERARTLGAEPVFALIPVRLQVDPDSHSWYAGLGYQVDNSMAGATVLARRLTDALSSRGVKYIDLAPALRKVEAEIFLEGDDHLNARGNVVAGQALFDGLACAGLLGRAAACSRN
jgi:hypothetical protein